MHVWNICLTHDPMYGGLYRAVNDFARPFDGRVLSFDDGLQNREGIDPDGPVHRVACGNGWLTRDCRLMPPSVARQADALVAQADLLIVHSLFRAHARWAQRWATEHARPYWAVPHGCLDPWGMTQRSTLKRLWLHLYGNAYFSKADRIIFSTRREMAKASPWIPTERAVVVHWPVALPSLEQKNEARASLRTRLGISQSARIMLSVSRLHSMKRPIELIDAFCKAASSHYHFVLVGMDGDLTQQQVAKAIPAALKDRVHVIGPLSGQNLVDAFLAADGFVSLSFRENFGYAAADAVAAGLPVILSPGHDLAYEMPIDSHGQLTCGWLLPDDSPNAASQAISEWIAATDSQLLAMGAIGRRWAADTLCVSRFSDALSKLAASATKATNDTR
ncbi:MAG: glycosyltransferase [Planctomycetia bacterium]|nr:glycosyltransferase [Planctomycetia bacterium]